MRVVFLANTDWYLFNFRLDLAKAVRAAGHEVILAAPEGVFRREIENEGFRFQPVRMSRRGVNPLEEWGAVRRMEALYRELQPDLVHHFTIKAVVHGSLGAKRAGVPAIVNAVAGLGYAFTDRSLKARLIRQGIVRALRQSLAGTALILQNPDDERVLAEAGILDGVSSHLIRGSGVDVHRFVPMPETEGPPLVVFASRMLWGKGVQTFVDAADRVRREMPTAVLALVGPTDQGNPAAVPEAQLKAWDESGTVEWWGFRHDMESVLSEAHVVCLPSEYGEGVPRILIEGAASGRPLVATDIPGCREICVDHKTGLLVRPGDPAALAEALLDLLRDRDLRQSLGRGARRLAEDEFSARAVIRSTFDVYRTVAAGIGAPPLPPS